MKFRSFILMMISILLLISCGSSLVAEENEIPLPSLTVPTTPSQTPEPPLETPTLIFTPTKTSTATPDTRPIPYYWSTWPVVPTASARVVQIYLQGVKVGVEPHTFSVVGDCQSEPSVFMGIYATYRNPIDSEYPDLQETILDFYDSFTHESISVRNGLSAPSALDPLWSDPDKCNPTEGPVACELRLYQPMIVFINLGTNWRPGASADIYAGYLREIVDLVIANGTVPILLNKADNVEGDHSINRATAQVAYDFDIPLINFWLAADQLPNHGLDAGRENIYLAPEGWNERNYVSLKTLDSVWRTLKDAYDPGN